MSNPCTNIMKVYFHSKEDDERYNFNNAQRFLKMFYEYFEEILYIWPEINEDDQEIEFEDFEENFEIHFTSKWTAPQEEMEKWSKEYDCEFLGVAYEWGNGYVDSFEINLSDYLIPLEKVILDSEMIDMDYESIGQVINDDPTANPRLWKWKKGNEIVITHDDGNGYCHVVFPENIEENKADIVINQQKDEENHG